MCRHCSFRTQTVRKCCFSGFSKYDEACVSFLSSHRLSTECDQKEHSMLRSKHARFILPLQMNLMQHHALQTHIRLKPYLCRYCEMFNTEKRLVKRHIAEIHPGKPAIVRTDYSQVSPALPPYVSRQTQNEAPKLSSIVKYLLPTKPRHSFRLDCDVKMVCRWHF